ncbi:unnamed protein product, partial [Rotaria sordida]
MNLLCPCIPTILEDSRTSNV